MALPIQKLPILVIQVILQTMGFVDVFLLTRTSTTMKRIVKNTVLTRKHNLFITIREFIIIQIQSRTNLTYAERLYLEPEESKPNRIFNMGIGSVHRLPSAIYKGEDGLIELDTFWKDTKAGCIELCNEFVEVFRAPVKGVILNLDEVENYQNEINWVNSTFPALNTFVVEGKCSLRDHMWMVKNVRATENLQFGMEPTEWTDEIGNIEIVPMELESFMIKHGRWVSLQQLQAIKSKFISIQDVDLSDSRFNEFFRNLKSSKEKASSLPHRDRRAKLHMESLSHCHTS